MTMEAIVTQKVFMFKSSKRESHVFKHGFFPILYFVFNFYIIIDEWNGGFND